MMNTKSLLWISISSLIFVIGLLTIYILIPIGNNLMFGSFSFPIKGLLSTILTFSIAWLTMIKLRTSTGTKSLISLATKGLLTVIIGMILIYIN